jgi:hypothetical protein
MAGALTISTLNNDTGVLATQNGMTGIAKAWVVYNGVTQTILNSFNISSITYVSNGLQQINFTTAMPNANYTCSGSASLRDTSADANLGIVAYARLSSSPITTTSCSINVAYPNFSLATMPLTCAIFHGS